MEFLGDNALPFQERVLDGSPASSQRLAALAGTDAVPVITVGEITLVGFDPERLGPLVGISPQAEKVGRGLIGSSRKLAHDLEMARRVHRSLLPADLEHQHLDVAVRTRPHIVGGDYASVSRVDDGRYYLAVSDVTGHGIASALLVSRVNSFVMGKIRRWPSPSQLVEELNDFLCSHFDGLGLFLTFFAARIDAEAGVLEYCGAGHPPGLLLRGEDEPLWLTSESPLLGVAADIVRPSQTRTLALQSGDVVVLYTDGILEARPSGGEQFGPARMVEALRRGLPRGVAGAAESVLAAVAQHEPGVASDDRLVLVTRFRE